MELPAASFRRRPHLEEGARELSGACGIRTLILRGLYPHDRLTRPLLLTPSLREVGFNV